MSPHDVLYDALEMAALLINIKPGDEVIVPSYTFVSSALAFIREGATIKFVDSRTDHPGLDEGQLEALISEKTKAIVVVHYAGVACDMDRIMELAAKHNLFVIEDAAQAIDSFYKGKPLGGIGHLGCFSFHETKNIQCGEGGMLVINDKKFLERAETIGKKEPTVLNFSVGKLTNMGGLIQVRHFFRLIYLRPFYWHRPKALDTFSKSANSCGIVILKT
jgi:dTDP-4-amino-4,6-dideoxygalactose transaminase